MKDRTAFYLMLAFWTICFFLLIVGQYALYIERPISSRVYFAVLMSGLTAGIVLFAFKVTGAPLSGLSAAVGYALALVSVQISYALIHG